MNVWILKTGEPLPVDGPDVRLLRSGSFATYLASRDCAVVWWAGTFDHVSKRQRKFPESSVQLCPNFQLWLIKSPGYKRHISIERQRDHQQVADRFSELSEFETKPDIIHCAYPTIDLSLAAVEYGRKHEVPVILDVRDLWPDLFLDIFPRPLRAIARILLRRAFNRAGDALAGAYAISGQSPGFVQFGLHHAMRSRGPYDRHFPFTYDVKAPEPGKLATATQFCTGHNICEKDGWFNICFFGNMAGEGLHHDYETPIKAVTHLAARGFRIRLLFCGMGSGADQMRKRFADSKNVVLLGWVDRTTLWKIMTISHLGLIPYKPSDDFAISLPNKSIEYLAGGLPVLTSLNRGYLFELFGGENCGVFYESGDVQGLALKLQVLIESPRRLNVLAKNSQRFFEREFSPEHVYGGMEQHLREVVDAYRMSKTSRGKEGGGR